MMANLSINAQTLGFFAPQSRKPTAGGSFGATVQGTPEKGLGAEIKSQQTPLTLSGNPYDSALNVGFGKTSEILGIPAQGNGLTFGAKPNFKPNDGLFGTLNAIDAKDIGLNGNRNGLEGQRFLNILA